jgi:hypothetical protein
VLNYRLQITNYKSINFKEKSKMRKRITLVILFLITFGFLTLNANADGDFDKAMLKAKKNLTKAMNKSDAASLTKSRAEFERILQLKKDLWLVNYYIALADYGLSLNASISQNTEMLKKYTQSGIDILNKSLDENPEFADSYVLLEALNFNRWQYEQEKMQDIISASQSADEGAKKIDPNNPRYVLINGIAHYWTPEQYGGGVKVCIPEFEKSIKLFESRKETSELYPTWGQDLAMGYMVLSLIKRDDEEDMKNAKKLIDDAITMNQDSKFLTEYVKKEYEKNSSSK